MEEPCNEWRRIENGDAKREDESPKGQKERVCVREKRRETEIGKKRERAWKKGSGGNIERGWAADERWRKNGG